jgi:hypothetical protein
VHPISGIREVQDKPKSVVNFLGLPIDDWVSLVKAAVADDLQQVYRGILPTFPLFIP